MKITALVLLMLVGVAVADDVSLRVFLYDVDPESWGRAVHGPPIRLDGVTLTAPSGRLRLNPHLGVSAPCVPLDNAAIYLLLPRAWRLRTPAPSWRIVRIDDVTVMYWTPIGSVECGQLPGAEDAFVMAGPPGVYPVEYQIVGRAFGAPLFVQRHFTVIIPPGKP